VEDRASSREVADRSSDGSVLRYLLRTFRAPEAEELTDGQLLERFVSGQDPAAFDTLMQRHAPLVWGVCRRVVHDPHDAEDAFQAAFMVLVRKAGSLERRDSLASWLYGVAYRIALGANSNAARRRIREQKAAAMLPTQQIDDASWDDLRPVLDAELNRLPEKYRAPLVLCYLEGKTNEQAAKALGWPAGSMSKRLDRGRELLRDRLASRGVALSAAALAMLMAQHAATAAVPAVLTELTGTMAQAMVASGSTLAGAASTQVVSLAEGALQAMFITKLKIAAASLAACVMLAGSGLLAQQVLAPQAEPPVPDAAPPTAAAPQITPEQMAKLQQLIKPGPADARWMQVSWMPSTNIWAARKKAADLGKPLFLWYMAGEPLGPC
jgi:RNA polymerase sigma factor (sigma-70 family)